jgi:hypothetical protein
VEEAFSKAHGYARSAANDKERCIEQQLSRPILELAHRLAGLEMLKQYDARPSHHLFCLAVTEAAAKFAS